MCRISGIANLNLPSSVIKERVLSMCQIQQHGGPDDEGVFVSNDGLVALGNRRLALVDLSTAGHQPMTFSERFTITFNGEIYNFKNIKSELTQLGYIFKTETDTEVILASFAEWGTLSFSKLEGMFAFALHDNLEQVLYLVRDPVGIKPLYFSTANSNLVFASEIRAFKAANLNGKENKKWPIFLMAYGHIPEPYTTFSDVYSLPKGSFLKYNLLDRSNSLQSYRHFSFSNGFNIDSEIAGTVRSVVKKAVRNHMLADAPIGFFLSGGIDSTILTKIASESRSDKINSLSIYFEEKGFSEKEFQDLVLKDTNCFSYQHLLTKGEFEQFLPDVLSAMDMPSCDGFNTWFISKYAKEQGLKAVISGIGADELFGGYPSFIRMKKALQLQSIPGFILNTAKWSNNNKIKRLSYLKMDGIKGLYLFLRGQYSVFDIAKHLEAYEGDIWNVLNDEPFVGDLPGLDSFNKASWMEFHMYMQNQLLRDADVMSMVHGVEIRVPFLDSEVVDLLMKTQTAQKFGKGLPKQLLIDAFKDLIPEPVWNRKKMGFSFPFSQWLKNNDFVAQQMQGGNKSSRACFDLFNEGKLSWYQLISILLIRFKGYA